MAMCPNGGKSGSVLLGYVIYGGEQSDDRLRCSLKGGVMTMAHLFTRAMVKTERNQDKLQTFWDSVYHF